MVNNKQFELVVYTFGNTPRIEDSKYGSTAQAIRDALEAIKPRRRTGTWLFVLIVSSPD